MATTVISSAIVNWSSVVPAAAPWCQYQPGSPGKRWLGSDALVACCSCMSTMTIDGIIGVISSYFIAAPGNASLR